MCLSTAKVSRLVASASFEYCPGFLWVAMRSSTA